MPYHAIKSSILQGAVPTDGVMYYCGSGRWSNRYDDRKIYEREEDVREELTFSAVTGLSYLPKGTQFISE